MSIEDKTQERDIDGTLFRVAPLQFSVGNAELARFTSLVSPAIGEVMAKAGEDEAKAMGALFGSLPAIFKNNGSELLHFTEVFGTQSSYQGGKGMIPMSNKASYEILFAGNYSLWFKWLALCIEVNFGGFFGDLLQGKLLNVGSLGAPENPST